MRATITEKSSGLAPRCALCEDGGRVRRIFSTVATIGGGSIPTRAGPSGGSCCGGGCGCGAG